MSRRHNKNRKRQRTGRANIPQQAPRIPFDIEAFGLRDYQWPVYEYLMTDLVPEKNKLVTPTGRYIEPYEQAKDRMHRNLSADRMAEKPHGSRLVTVR